MIDDLRDFIAGAGPAGPIVFVIAYAVLTVLLVPGSVLTLAAGTFFGPLWGTLLTATGATLGATAAFIVARRAGRRQVERRLGARAERADAWIAGRGFLSVLYVRLIPAVPFNVFNYAAGLTAIGLRDYVAATALGILPGTFAFVALGDALGDPGSQRFLLALGLVLALAVSAPLIDRARRRRAAAATEQPVA